MDLKSKFDVVLNLFQHRIDERPRDSETSSERRSSLKYFLAMWAVLAIAIFLTMFHQGHLLVDCGREVYYPTQILLGKVLYKDLFNIYGPFSYMFNAFLFKIFGIHLNVLYAAGVLCSFAIVNLTYLIAKRFLTPFLSFCIAVFTISVGVLNFHLFNFVFPYSYAMLYGLVAFMVSFWFLVKYEANSDKTVYLYLSALFAGLCVVSKYEFLPYLFVILYSMIKIKPLKFIQYYYSLLALSAVPIFCLGTLFLQGLGINDLISTFDILAKMAHSKTLNYFYQHQGIYFNPATIFLLSTTFLMTTLSLLGFVKGLEFKNKAVSYILIGLSLTVLIMNPIATALSFLPLAVLALAIWDYKNIKGNVALQLLALSAILFSLKIFLSLILLSYGAFFASFLLIAALALVMDKLKDRNINQNAIGVYVLILAGFVTNFNWNYVQKPEKVSTTRGQIYASGPQAFATNALIDYINKNTKKSDKVVIFPEGLLTNFLADRQSDDYYNSLIPLYAEVFGDEKLIEHFKETKPEYIVFHNGSTKDYYFEYICSDYAVTFCNFVATNYFQEPTIEKFGFRYLIFKKKDAEKFKK